MYKTTATTGRNRKLPVAIGTQNNKPGIMQLTGLIRPHPGPLPGEGRGEA